MSLIKSISGIRGTIGGRAGDGLSPLDIVKFASAYATFIRRTMDASKSNVIVVGRDARLSGRMVLNTVVGTLTGMGFDVVNIGLATTPTTELAVTWENAAGGIIITASHNPRQWNALKLLNSRGEFLTDAEGKEVLRIAEAEDFDYADVDHLGREQKNYTYLRRHIDHVLSLELVDVDAIRKADFTVAVDAVNSIGGVAIPQLLQRLGVKKVVKHFCDPTGNFGHTPEPIPENLTQISDYMKQGKADVAFVVDPDVDRLAIIMENGEFFVEEYTLVAVADYVLQHTPGATVSNLSSSRALRDVTEKYGQKYTAAAAGEVNASLLDTSAEIGEDGITLTKGMSASRVDTDALFEQVRRAFLERDYADITAEIVTAVAELLRSGLELLLRLTHRLGRFVHELREVLHLFSKLSCAAVFACISYIYSNCHK